MRPRVASPWRLHAARLLTVLSIALARPPLALAQTTTPTAPADLPLRDANFAWDQGLLRASFSFKDVLADPAVRQKLSNGPTSTIVMRGYVIREGETNPVWLTLQTCKVTYDLWEDVYNIQLVNASGRTERPVANLAGVERYCTTAQDLPITSRSSLRAGAPHFLAVIVDVNPVSEDVRQQMRQWMQRPVGAAEVGPGDALFSGLVLLLFRDVGGSDRTVQFRTRTFVP
jgi:hypothetical protein